MDKAVSNCLFSQASSGTGLFSARASKAGAAARCRLRPAAQVLPEVLQQEARVEVPDAAKRKEFERRVRGEPYYSPDELQRYRGKLYTVGRRSAVFVWAGRCFIGGRVQPQSGGGQQLGHGWARGAGPPWEQQPTQRAFCAFGILSQGPNAPVCICTLRLST